MSGNKCGNKISMLVFYPLFSVGNQSPSQSFARDGEKGLTWDDHLHYLIKYSHDQQSKWPAETSYMHDNWPVKYHIISEISVQAALSQRCMEHS